MSLPTREQLHENRDTAISEAARILDGAEAENRELNDAERAVFDRHRETAEALTRRLDDLKERDAAAERVASVPSLNFNSEDRGYTSRDDREHLGRIERAAVQTVDEMRWASDDVRETLTNLIEADDDPQSSMARWTVATGSADYRSAFTKFMRDPERGWQDFTKQEQAAWGDVKSVQRAMSYGTNTAGGYLVPAHLDPAIYATNAGAASPIPALAHQIVIATHDWTGVTSDGVTMSWDAELVEVSDDSPTLAPVTITTFKAAGFIGASIELTEDSDIASQVPELFADARDRLEAAAFNTGNGTTAPTGIWTALQADTTVQLVSTTAAAIGLVDLQAAYRLLPVRWRSRASWLMNPRWQSDVQNLGTALSNSFTTDATSVPDRLLTKQLFTDDFAPALSTTTALDARIIIGDFSSYYIIRRVGMSIEYLPHLFSTSNNRPIGARGWYTHFRTGAKPVSPKAFIELVDKTSA